MKRQAWKRMQAWLLVVAMLVSVVTGIGTTKTAKAATKMGVTYTVHVQTYGDQQGWVHDGTMAGTKGQAKRLEEIRVKLTGDEYSGSIQYKTHIQSYGWQDWSYNGEKSGSRGQAKRLEGIEIQLTGEVAKHYDVVYRVHCQTYGWMDWVKNGVMAGTSGQAKRLEGIEIKLVPKSQIVDMGVQYRVHCQTHTAQAILNFYIETGSLFPFFIELNNTSVAAIMYQGFNLFTFYNVFFDIPRHFFIDRIATNGTFSILSFPHFKDSFLPIKS